MNDDADVVSTLARSITNKVKHENPSAFLLPGRVVNAPTTPGVVSVQIAGDPDGSSRDITNLIHDSLGSNDVIMVLFDPPEGAYAIARVDAPLVDSATLRRNTDCTPFNVPYNTQTVIPMCVADHEQGRVTADTASSSITVEISSLYLIQAQLTWAVNSVTSIGFEFQLQVRDDNNKILILVPRTTQYSGAATPVKDTLVGTSIRYLTSGTVLNLQAFSNMTVNGANASIPLQDSNDNFLSVTSLGGQYVTPVI